MPPRCSAGPACHHRSCPCCHVCSNECAQVLLVTHRDSGDADAAAKPAKPVREHRSATMLHAAPATAPKEGQPVSLPSQRHRPSPEPQQDGDAAGESGAGVADAQDTGAKGAEASRQEPRSAPAPPQPRSSWLPRPDGVDQRRAWQDASRGVAHAADVPVHVQHFPYWKLSVQSCFDSASSAYHGNAVQWQSIQRLYIQVRSRCCEATCVRGLLLVTPTCIRSTSGLCHGLRLGMPRAQKVSCEPQQAGEGWPAPLLRPPLGKRDANGDLKHAAGARLR